MSRSTSLSLFDRLRTVLTTLMGRPGKSAPAFATVPVRRLPRRANRPSRW
jgi:hypothetical protein